MTLSQVRTIPMKNTIENLVEKGGNTSNRHFQLFPTTLSTSYYSQISLYVFLSADTFNFDKSLTIYSIDTHFDVSTTDSF